MVYLGCGVVSGGLCGCLVCLYCGEYCGQILGLVAIDSGVVWVVVMVSVGW